jgi:hypothetical protein
MAQHRKSPQPQERHRAEVQELDEHTQRRLKELEAAGELLNIKRSHNEPLPVIHLTKPARLDRIVKLAKR